MKDVDYSDFLLDEDLEKWSEKFGYSFYENIEQTFSVDKKIEGKFVACVYDIDEEKFVDLVKKSIKDDKDYIAAHVNKSNITDDAVI